MRMLVVLQPLEADVSHMLLTRVILSYTLRELDTLSNRYRCVIHASATHVQLECFQNHVLQALCRDGSHSCRYFATHEAETRATASHPTRLLLLQRLCRMWRCFQLPCALVKSLAEAEKLSLDTKSKLG
jgi:hypothetical protein